MDYSVNKGELAVCETVYDGCQEQPVDLDFSLPDYCPDIQRILKCQVYPRVQMRSVSGDRLDVEGVVAVKLLYLDADKLAVRCFDHSSPFSCSFNLKRPAQDAVIQTKTHIEYINCRAVSPRKLDIHGAFSVCAKVFSRAQQDVVCDIPGEDIQQKKIQINAGSLVSTAQQQFTVSEVLEISQGKPEAETIIRMDVIPVMHDYKAIANKMIIKGEALIKILYAGSIDENAMETMEYSIPISQIIEAQGLTEGSLCDCRLDVLTSDVQVRPDGSGENTLLDVDIRLAAAVIAFEEREMDLVTDAYSTDYELELEYKTITLERLQETLRDAFVFKDTYDVGENGVARVIDVWNEMASVTAQAENNKIVYRGKFNACILAVSNDGEPLYSEKLIDFEFSRDWSGTQQSMRCDAEVALPSLGYRIAGSGSIEIRAELTLSCAIYQSGSHRTVSYVTADENRPRIKDTTASLIIYYADAGESIWNIARNYCTSADAIKEENDMTDDHLESRRMLLIPV
jgi:hypothetical protein